MVKPTLSKGYQLDYLEKVGLTILREDGKHFDRFKGRVMFPIQSLSGRNLGFGGRILNNDKKTICPLCLRPLSANGFFSRLEQAVGRVVPDLTVTEINLFHIKELRTGEYNHMPYNLGWGHHHCNVVTKDSGIFPTLKWMNEVIEENKSKGAKF